jgi:hypothetical protein
MENEGNRGTECQIVDQQYVLGTVQEVVKCPGRLGWLGCPRPVLGLVVVDLWFVVCVPSLLRVSLVFVLLVVAGRMKYWYLELGLVVSCWLLVVATLFVVAFVVAEEAVLRRCDMESHTRSLVAVSDWLGLTLSYDQSFVLTKTAELTLLRLVLLVDVPVLLVTQMVAWTMLVATQLVVAVRRKLRRRRPTRISPANTDRPI